MCVCVCVWFENSKPHLDLLFITHFSPWNEAHQHRN